MKISWLGVLNRIILQWFFIRLARIVDDVTGKTLGYKILKWVVPLTGWGSDYKFIGKNHS